MFWVWSFKRLEMLSTSRVKPAKMLMMRSLPMTSEILKPSVSADGVLSDGVSFEDPGRAILGTFMMGLWSLCLKTLGDGLEGVMRKKFGRTSCASVVPARIVLVRTMSETEVFIVVLL